MRRRVLRGILGLTGTAAALFAGPVGGAAPDAEAGVFPLTAAALLDDGSAAPAGTWLGEAGCAARTAASRSEPLRGPVEVAWRCDLPRDVVSDPVVSASRAFVETADPKGARTLVALRLSDGAVVAEAKVGAVPLRMVVAGGLVVVASAPDAIAAYRLSGRKLTSVWKAKLDAPLASMVALGARVFVRTRTGVVAFDAGGADSPVWRSDGGEPTGEIAARANGVYVTFATSAGLRLCRFDAESGDQDGAAGVSGPWTAGESERDTQPRLTVTAAEVFAQSSLGFETASGGRAGAACATRSEAAGVNLVASGLFGLCAPPVEVPGGWIAPLSEKGGPARPEQLFLSISPDGRGYGLAKAGARPEWMTGWELASQARGVVYHPAGALDVETRRMLWTFPLAPRGRIVPVRHGVLFVHGPKSVVALGPRGASAEHDIAIGPGVPAEATDAKVVLADGTIVSGKARKEGDAVVLDGKPVRKFPLGEVLLVEDPAGRTLHAPNLAALDEAVAAAFRSRRAAEFGKLLLEIVPGRDAVQVARVAREVRSLGGDEALVKRADFRIKDLTKQRNHKADPAVAAKVDGLFARFAAEAAGSLAARLRSLPEDTPRAVVLAFCRRVLADAPNDPEAVRRVRALLPPGLAKTEPFDALAWVSIAELVGHMPIEVLEPPAPGVVEMSRAQRAVAIQSVTWRKDVIGLKSPQLLVISPLRRPDAIAKLLAFGELAGETLQAWCATGNRVRDTREPLTLIVHESKEDYERLCAGKSARGGHDLTWSAGHYSPGEQISRLYLPEDDVALERALAVFVHELTHHWVDERCPLFGDSDRKETAKTKGYWIVEGFAEFVEHVLFDPVRGTWTLDPFAEPLEFVTGVPPSKLLPWGTFFEMTHGACHALGKEFKIPMAPRRSFEGPSRYSETHVFYMQAAATCHYLFEADGGAHRPKLLAYLAARYTGKPPTVEEAFGMSADELGRRVVEFAERTLREAR